MSLFMNSLKLLLYCINTHSGVGTLGQISANMNFEKYIETLDQNLWSVIAKFFGNVPFIFTINNNENDLDYLDRPSPSPGINIIENK